jgi:trans-2,3-dihydro-3-hydroxyanthranilate isomerase
MRDYLVYDVFTETPLGGNQLAILPDAAGLSTQQMQAIAAEFNFPETVFLGPPETDGCDARVRIFTPTVEVPFAGHPTIGTAVMLAEAGLGPAMTLELGVGPIAAQVVEGLASFTTEHPLVIEAKPARALVARALGCTEDQIIGQPVMAGLGLAFTFTQLATREALSALAPDIGAMREGNAAYPSGLDFAQCAWVESAPGVIHMRMFAPLDNIPKDPATGSAAAALGALLCAERGAITLDITQGTDMGRPSRIEVMAEPGKVTVSGRAVRVMEGKLLV